jgi:hypothetical protein
LYSRKDSEFVVDRLRAELHARGHEVWMDVDMLGGAKWRPRVKRGIEACKALIFVVSPDSVVSTARLWDVASHRQLGKPLGGHEADRFWGVAFRPDGRTLATGTIATPYVCGTWRAAGSWGRR